MVRPGARGLERWSDAAGAGAAVEVLDRPLRNQRLAGAHGVVLAERMPLELLIEEHALEVGVALEADAIEVPHEALPPGSALVHGQDRGDFGGLAADPDLEADHVVPL